MEARGGEGCECVPVWGHSVPYLLRPCPSGALELGSGGGRRAILIIQKSCLC